MWARANDVSLHLINILNFSLSSRILFHKHGLLWTTIFTQDNMLSSSLWLCNGHSILLLSLEAKIILILNLYTCYFLFLKHPSQWCSLGDLTTFRFQLILSKLREASLTFYCWAKAGPPATLYHVVYFNFLWSYFTT